MYLAWLNLGMSSGMNRRLQQLISSEPSKKPTRICHDSLSTYLKQDFETRQAWIDTIPPKDRLTSLLYEYPSFKYPIHVSLTLLHFWVGILSI